MFKTSWRLLHIITMEDINEYIKLDQKKRKNHIDLSMDCMEIGGNGTQFKGLLSHYLELTIHSGYMILLCHACHNSKCSNPKHIYYGTPKENLADQKENGTYKSVWERMVKKYGIAEARQRQSRGSKAALGGLANKGKPKSEEHRKNISKSIAK